MDPTVMPTRLGDVRCTSLGVDIEVPLDKFDIDALRSKMGAAKDARSQAAICNTRDPVTADYHVHIGWRLLMERPAVALEIEYVSPAIPSKPNESEPFAETTMQWLGTFMKFAEVSAEISAYFRYGKEARLLVFPLPFKTTFPTTGLEAEVNGITFDLPSRPGGFYRVYVTQRPATLSVSVQAERRVDLASFSLAEQLSLASSFVETLVRRAI